MKRLILFLALCVLVSGLSGCVYNRTLVMKIKGDKVKAPLMSVSPIEGDGISGTLILQTFWTTEKGRSIPLLSDINITDEIGNTGSIDIYQPPEKVTLSSEVLPDILLKDETGNTGTDEIIK